MKISNSKKELARIISENGGWKDQKAEWSAQDGSDGQVSFFKIKAPTYSKPEKEWMAFGDSVHCYHSRIECCKVIKNFHQTILSRDEYFHLYPAPDADGWIEWTGGACPVDDGALVDIRISSGKEMRGQRVHPRNWVKDGSFTDIISYRLHKPEIAPVAGVVPEPVVEAKPTIEQLAADYRNLKDYAQRKQQEADNAKADAEDKLAELVAAGKALWLVLSVAAPEPELVITDWRDLQLNDIIEYIDGDIKDKIGMTGPVVEFAKDDSDGMPVRLKCDNGPNKGRLGWPRKWRFIRRP